MTSRHPRHRSGAINRTKLVSAVKSYFEGLERRELLAAQVWVNDNWLLRTDTGPQGLSIGDVVDNSGAGESGETVTATWGVTGFGTISEAVHAVDAGGTVNVLAGRYRDNLTLDKSVKLRGQGTGNTILRSSGAAESIVLVRHAGVDISLITIDGGSGSGGGGPEGGGPTVGIDINGGSTSINNTSITGNDIGVRVRNGGSILSMQENFVTNNNIAALEVQATAGSVSAVFNNDLSGLGLAVSNAAAIVNASGNYFGADTTQAGVAARNTGSVDFTPWLNSGTDTSGSAGFQGQFTDMNVGAAGSQSGSVGRIREGITLAAAGSNVFVHPGTYGESDINVNKAVVIDGVGAPSGVVVAPAVADAHLTGGGQVFNPSSHNAFVIRSGNVTIKDLTIDGDAGVGGAGSKNYFGGIVYDYNLGSAFNNLQAKNLTVTNIWRVGIYFDGGINALSTGHTVMDNAVSNVSGGTGAAGLLMLQASGNVTNNNITAIDGDGIATNYIDGEAYAPTISIKGNTISGTQTGMNLSGLASGSAVGGTGVGEPNSITMTGGGDDTGIVVQYAVGAVTVQGNTITGDGDDSGIWLYHNAQTATPSILGNNLTSTGSTSTNDGDGTGVFVTDDGSFFTESSGGNSYATISGNTISGFFRGIDLFRNEDNPAGGFTVNATIDGNNKIDGGNTGVRVFDSNGTTAADAVANITGNNASIHGNAIGIDVAGGTATITSNHIYDNGVGVQVRDGGVATINNNDFNDADDNGTDVLVRSSAPGGIAGGAMSGNNFAGDSFFVDNESAQNISVLPGSGNTFDVTGNFRIEDHMHHRADSDRASAGKVTVVANQWFVTDPAIGVGSTDSSIQFAVNAASSGDTVNIEGGTYNENVTVGKAITLDGEGNAATPIVNWRGATTSPLVTITSTNTTDDITVLDVAFDGQNSAGSGIRAWAPAADFDALTVNRSTFTGLTVDAIDVSGDATTGIAPRNVVIQNSSFSSNGSAGSGGTGDISLFQYNGDATLSDLTLVGSAGTTGARIGIQMRGVGAGSGVGVMAMGNVSMSNIDISGSYRTSFLGLQRYSSVSTLSLSNVALGGATSEVGGGFGALMRRDAVGAGSVASPASINLGNTHFRGLSGTSAQQAFLEFAPDNTFTFLRADATSTRWDLSSGTNVTASAMTQAQAFEATDRMLDYVKPNHPLHGAFKGWAELQNGKAFNTPLSSNINRGIEMVDANGTVHVKEGTYAQAVNVNRAVTLKGAQAGVDARGRGGPESVLTTDLADETLGIVNVTAANAVIDGFTIDGDGPVAGGVLLLDGTTQSNAARGVVVDADNASVLNNIVNNTYRRGVQFWVNASTAPIGGLVNQNEFNVIGANVGTAANSGDAVLAFADPSVTNNDVNTARTGVTFIQVYAPSVTPITISGNDIDAINGIALNETSSGIPTITITNNTVTTDDNGTGLQLWTVDGSVSVSGNTFTGTGVGDRGVYAWDGTGNDPMNVTLTGGSFAGYQTGVYLTNEEQDGPFGPALANATLNLDGVSIASAAAGTGVHVNDTAAGTFDVRVNITNDSNISTGGTGTGVRVSGPVAKARIVDNDNSITNNATGVDVDGGVAMLQGNNLNGNSIGALVRGGGKADLGQNGPGTNFTGLGISTGGNNFSGYTSAATSTAGAIVNLNNNAPNNLAGRQGLPDDVPAFGNTWAVNTASGIENVIYHDVDDSTRGFVDYAVFGNLAVSLTTTAVNEGGSTTVNGSFTDVAAPHTVTINWGDGSPNSVVNLSAGVANFSIPSPAGTTYGDDPNGPVNSVNYAIAVTVAQTPSGSSLSDNSLGVTVSNVAPKIAVSGGSNVNEGSVYTLNLGAITDPGQDTVTRYIINWGDGAFDDITANPANTVHTHTYDDGTLARNVTISMFDEDAAPHFNTGQPDPFTLTVNNVAPTGNFFNGGPVPEGSNGFVGFGAQFDPSTADTGAGFRYSYDFNNDGDFTDASELSDVTNASVGVPAAYLNDGPGSRTVRARIKDKDGGFTDYTTTLTIFNVTPFVNGGPDVNVPANTNWSQLGSFADPGADSPWTGTVDYDISDANPPVNLPLSGFNFTLSHAYATPGTYTVRVTVTDKDGATGQDDVLVTVGPTPTFQVNQFLVQPSGFTLRFNRAVDTATLNLFDGLFGTTPSAEPADITLVGNTVGAVAGSVVWDPVNNIATFIRTGGPLATDTYTLTVRSANNAVKDTLGNLLDGNANGTPGDDYTQTFNTSNPFNRTLSIPDFARGPDSGSNINVPNTGTLGLPVRIDDGSQVRSVDFRVTYDPSLLNITGAQLAAGMPGDWSITSNLSTPGTAIITVFGTTSDLPAGPQNIVKLVANVPSNAPYGAAEALRLLNITVSKNDATTLPTRGDSGIHKVMYFGDADGDRAYTGFDAGLISRVVVNLDSGFHTSPLVDPVILGDIDGSAGLSGIDASFVAQKAALLPRPEIPNLPGILPPLIPGGVDPQFSTPDNKPGRPGGTVTMPINIDDASGTLGYNLTLDYNTALLDLANANVQLGSLYQTAGGWSLVANVDDATGHATLVFWRANGVPMPAGSGGGTVASATFTVASSATNNTTVPIELDGNPGGSGLVFSFDDGSVLVDAVAPSILADNYKYQTAPHKLEFTFSEDVAASLVSGDFVVTNTTTNTTIPAADFALTYNVGTNVATLSYVPSGGVLPDGNYTVSITAGNVTDAAGNPLAANFGTTFFFLMGDANHDGRVNLNDFNILAANFGQSPRDFTQADFDYNGVVNLNDFNILASRFGTVLGPDGAISPPTGNAPSLPPRPPMGGGSTDVTGSTGGSSGGSGGEETGGTGASSAPGATSGTTTRPGSSATTTTTSSTSTSPFSTIGVGSTAGSTSDPLVTTSAYTSPSFANRLIGTGRVRVS